MTDRLRITVSGIRGIVPDALDVGTASRFASAFTSYLEEGSLAICRDNRSSSHMLQMAVVSAIIAGGLECTDFGRIPVSFLQFHMSRQRNRFSGGIAVSAGHNPHPWNAVILLNESGYYLESSEGSELFNIYEAESFQKADWNQLGRLKREKFPLEHYLQGIAEVVDKERIRKAGFKVVADPCNGIVSPFLKPLAEFFNLKLIAINDNPEKPFPHPPEPNSENSSQTEAVVKAVEADLGFLFNTDGSRISFVDEKGTALSEELTVPLCLLSLKGRIQKAVTTAATSSWIDWAAQQAGIKILRTKVGQSSVTHAMEISESEAGGEGSGSFAYAPFSPGYDALLALALVLDLLAKQEKHLSQLTEPFPILFQKKIKIPVSADKTYRVMDRLEEVFAKDNPDYTDGVRIKRPGAWFIIRPSSTEFILRIMIEGKNPDIIEDMEEEILERVGL